MNVVVLLSGSLNKCLDMHSNKDAQFVSKLPFWHIFILFIIQLHSETYSTPLCFDWLINFSVAKS